MDLTGITRNEKLRQYATVFLIGILLLATAIPAAASFPLVRNFTRNEFAGGAKTWDMSQDADGLMYFANLYGMISFDGRVWTPYALSNESEVRCLAIDEPSGRIYAGGSEEFGYFAIDPSRHDLVYHSLAQLVDRRKHAVRDLWNIYISKGTVWFQGDYELFRYDGKHIKVFPSTRKITASALIGGRIYTGCEDGTFSILDGTRFHAVANSCLAGKRIVGIGRAPGRNTVLILTSFDGIYEYDGTSITPMPTEFDSFMRENQVFCAAFTDDDLAIGTVNNGLMVKRFSTGTLTYANRGTGMQNNTVLSLMFDHAGNIWAGLDNGIDYIDYNSPIRTIFGSTNAYGSGYDSFLAGNLLYLGTNQGLFTCPYPIVQSPVAPTLTQILKGQVWQLDTLGGSLMASTDGGLYSVSGSSCSRIEGVPGAWCVQQILGEPGYALASTYDGFYLLRQEGAAWRSLGKVSGYSGIGGRFIQDQSGNIWIAHWMRGIYRLRINVAARHFDIEEFFDSRKGLPSDKSNNVLLFGNAACFSTVGGFYYFEPSSGKMKKHPTLNRIFAGMDPGTLFIAPDHDIWNMGMSDGITVARSTLSGSYEADSVSYRSLADRQIHGFESLTFIDGDRAILSVLDGFFTLSTEWHSDSIAPLKVNVTRVTVPGDTILYHIGEKGDLRVPYALNSLRFEFSLPEYRSADGVRYSCYLEDYDRGWNDLGNTGSKEYTRLQEGTYTLHIRAHNAYNRTTSDNTLRFTVSPPWYRSTIANVIYAILLIAVGTTLYRYFRRHEALKARKATERKEEELQRVKRQAQKENLEKEIEIADLKGQQLEQQVRHKSEELSNAMLNLSRKNEVLQAVAQDLEKLRRQIADGATGRNVESQFKRIQSAIAENISHDDDWRKFTHNFDAVYEGFMKRLQKKHPTLTRSELRVCCYLRMGLSSKDMAPLFNISYRSVEMTRYRVRKKLGLAREDNLSEYLEAL